MIGIDTNLLLRVILVDDPRQAAAARDFIAGNCSAGDPGYISNIVLVELAWSLAKPYAFSRARIADVIEQILETAQLQVESSTDVAAAVREYRSGSADFADCLLGRSNLTAECSHTVTFDRKAAKLTGFELLSDG
jgi:predicted nucleic-acid-binding protein